MVGLLWDAGLEMCKNSFYYFFIFIIIIVLYVMGIVRHMVMNNIYINL